MKISGHFLLLLLHNKSLEEFRRSHFDLVGVHAGVGDQDLHVLHPLGLVHSDLLVQQETWTKQRHTAVLQAANQNRAQRL